LEIKREKIRATLPLDEPGPRTDLRVRQLRARDMLRGELAGADLEEHVNEAVMTTRLDKVLNWGRANAIFPATFGLACCAIEMMSVVSPRYDIARFGAEAMRASPRQADMLILSGRVSIKMAPVVRRLYDQMLEPKWVVSMGACSSSGGMFANYAVIQGADKFLPVDIHVPGCPPRPEALLYGFNKLQRMITGNPDQGWRSRYNAHGTEEWAHTDSELTTEAEEAYAAARTAAEAAGDLAGASDEVAVPAAEPAGSGGEPSPAGNVGEAEAAGGGISEEPRLTAEERRARDKGRFI
jgi:NADH-quinone oxidoreductase subunit B